MPVRLSPTAFSPVPPPDTRHPSSRESARYPVPGDALSRVRPSPRQLNSSSPSLRTVRVTPKARAVGANPAAPPVSLMLIEDNRLLCEAITAMIHTQPGLEVLAAFADADEALPKAREAKPDVVLLDFGMKSHGCLSLAATVHGKIPAAKVIVMGLPLHQEELGDYVRSGASGFITKDASFKELFATICAVAGGAQVLPPALTTSLFSQIARSAGVGSTPRVTGEVRLTSRERQVIDLLGEGLSNKEICIRLNIAVHTVKSHVHSVLKKLALHTRLEVVAFAHGRRGVIEARRLPPIVAPPTASDGAR